MQRSTHRILTTHCGSLPRPNDLLEMLMAREQGRLHDMPAFHTRVREAIGECVRKQRDTGLDIVNDGEWSKPDYSTYVKNRFTGFEGEPTPPDTSRDMLDFPEYAPYRRTGLQQLTRPKCNGPIAWKDFDAVQRDIDNLKAAAGNAEEVFMTAVSPGQVARFQGNSYYKSDEEYLWALADVLKDEYKAITDAGFTLQLDCPDLGSGWNGQFRSLTLAEFRKVVDLHLEVLNAATKDIPPERMRLHLCWGNYEGPHHHDIPLREIIEPVLQAQARGGLLRGRQPPSRARMDRLRGREAARREMHRPGRDRLDDQLHRAPGARRPAHRALCGPRGARECHRRRRLRLRDLRWRAHRAASDCLGEARCPRGGRPHRQPEAVGTPHMKGKRQRGDGITPPSPHGRHRPRTARRAATRAGRQRAGSAS